MEMIEENEKAKAAASFTDDPITVQVKFSGQEIPVSILSESSILDLKSHLSSITDVLTRCQMLIYKGNVYEDVVSLSSLQITNGSQFVMKATQDKHFEILPIRNQRDHLSKATANLRVLQRVNARAAVFTERNLKAFPDELWDYGWNLRKVDFSSNFIEEMPNKISLFWSWKELYLNNNLFCDEKFSWNSISNLYSLTVLSLSKNKLTNLPPAVGYLIFLRELDISNNQITCLPNEIRYLNQLQIFRAQCNRIRWVPASIGNCSNLYEVDLSVNLLTKLPETFEQLQNLKVLRLHCNDIRTLSSTLITMTTKLSNFTFYGTEIKQVFARQIEGRDVLDWRKCAKYLKGVDPHVGTSRVFGDGSDNEKEQFLT